MAGAYMSSFADPGAGGAEVPRAPPLRARAGTRRRAGIGHVAQGEGTGRPSDAQRAPAGGDRRWAQGLVLAVPGGGIAALGLVGLGQLAVEQAVDLVDFLGDLVAADQLAHAPAALGVAQPDAL